MDNKFELPREGVRIYDPKSGWQDSSDKPGVTADEANQNQYESEEQDLDQAQDASYDQPEDNHDEQESYDDQELLDEQDADSRDSEGFDEEEQHQAVEDEAAIPHDDELLDAVEKAGQQSHRHSPFEPGSSEQAHSPEAFAAEALRSLSDNLSSAGALASYSGPTRGKPAAGLVPQGQAAALAKVGDSLDGLFTVIQRSTLANTVDGSAPSWRDVANVSRHLEGRLNTRQELLKELTKVDREIRDTRDDLLLTLKALSDFEQQNLQAASMRASISSVAARVIAKRFEEPSSD